MKLLRLPRSKVRLGAPVPWNVRDEDEQLLLKKGQLVVTEHQLDALLARGAFVDAEELKAARDQPEVEPSEEDEVPSPSLFSLWDEATHTLKKMTADMQACTDPTGSDNFAGQLDSFAKYLIRLVDNNPNIAIYRCLRQEQTHYFYYGYAHALHTAVLCLLLGRYLRWPGGQVMTLVKAAITMNLAIFELQGQLAGQDKPLSDSQRNLIHAHPLKSVELLQRIGVTQADWLDTIVQHHEQLDGSGYPAALTQVSEMAVALRIADVFMAKISPRLRREPLSTQEAARQLFREDQGGRLSTALIKVFGIYPPGEFVKLASGELGLVIERTDNVRSPVVAAITNSQGQPTPRTARRSTLDPAFAISAVVSDKALIARLPPERLYGYAKVTSALHPKK